MNKFTIFFLIVFLVIGLNVSTSKVEARIVTFPLEAIINTRIVNRNVISGTFQHDFNFKLSNNALASNTINIPTNETIRGINTPTYGSWFINGGSYSTNPMDSRFTSKDGDTITTPEDRSNPTITSSNNNIISCNGLDCVAKQSGTAQVKVDFSTTSNITNTPYFSGGKYYFSNNNYITYKAGEIDNFNNKLNPSHTYKEFFTDAGLDSYSCNEAPNISVFGYSRIGYIKNVTSKQNIQNLILCGSLGLGYQFDSITYNVTVNSKSNNPPTTTYSGTSQITSNSAKASWTYSDPENDPQTGSQLQVASDANFTNIIFNGMPGAVKTGSITGLSGNTTYYPRVKVYSNNVESAWASGSSFTTQPMVPLADITFTANPTQVYRGDTFTLAWDVKNANGCMAGDEWFGNKSLNGTEQQQVASNAPSGQHTYSLRCTNSGGDTTKSVTVNVVDRPTPTVDVSVNNNNTPGTLQGGSPITINWTTINPDSIGTCIAQGQWTGNKIKTGGTDSRTLPNPSTQTTYNYELNCTKLDGGSINDVVNVTVNPSINVSCTTTSQVIDSSGKVEVKATVTNGSDSYMFTLDPDGGTSSALPVNQPNNEKVWSVDYSSAPVGKRNPKVNVTTNGQIKSNISCGSVTNYGKRSFKEVSP